MITDFKRAIAILKRAQTVFDELASAKIELDRLNKLLENEKEMERKDLTLLAKRRDKLGVEIGIFGTILRTIEEEASFLVLRSTQQELGTTVDGVNIMQFFRFSFVHDEKNHGPGEHHLVGPSTIREGKFVKTANDPDIKETLFELNKTKHEIHQLDQTLKSYVLQRETLVSEDVLKNDIAELQKRWDLAYNTLLRTRTFLAKLFVKFQGVDRLWLTARNSCMRAAGLYWAGSNIMVKHNGAHVVLA